MADTTTTNIALTKPGVADPAGRNLWGDKWNTNADTIDAVFKGDGTGTSHGANIGTGKTLSLGGSIVAAASSVANFLLATVSVVASRFSIKDATDNTKAAAFDVSGITTATTRTLTLPNADGTIALTSDFHLRQVVHAQTGSMATGVTQIPTDNTIPQSTEGDQYMTAAVTPKSATSKLEIEVTVVLSKNAVGGTLTVALFQDSGANALAAVLSAPAADSPMTITFRHQMTSGTTSSTIFKVRAGLNTSGTVTFNGVTGTAVSGGVLASSITIREYE